MAQLTWEKPIDSATHSAKSTGRGGERLKFLIGGVLILGAVLYLVFSSTLSGARYFITVEEVVNNPQYVGQTVRLTGAVIGDSIQYDASTGELAFTVAHMESQTEDLAQALHLAANNPDALRLNIFMADETMPDLLQHEAQAIVSGYMGEDGTFYASELLLKCPSRFQEDTPASMGQPAQEF